MFAVVSTIDDHNEKFVRLFRSKSSAESWAVNYIRENHAEGFEECEGKTNAETLENFIYQLGMTEWFFVIECEQ